MSEFQKTAFFDSNVEAIENYFASGIKEDNELRVGLEVEHFVLNYDPQSLKDVSVVDYEHGLKDILEQMLKLAPEAQAIIIDGQLMGLEGKSSHEQRLLRAQKLKELIEKHKLNPLPSVKKLLLELSDFGLQETKPCASCKSLLEEEIGFAVSLEPASQLEIAVGPSMNVYQAQVGLKDFYALFYLAAHELGLSYRLETKGYNPLKDARDLPLIKKERYRLMDEHFSHTGEHGIDMMRGSASTQVSLDFSSEQNFIKRYRLTCALGPVFAFLFDNASAAHSKKLKHAKRMVRSYIWRDTDSVRCGVPPTLFDSNFGFKAYTQWVLSVPAILMTTDEGKSIDTKHLLVRDLANVDHPLSKHDIEHLLSMVFPNTRLKNFIEIRDVDSLPEPFVAVFAALVEGLIYNDEISDKIASYIGMDSLSIKTLMQCRTDLMNKGWEAHVYGHGIQELAYTLVEYAQEALIHAANENPHLEILRCDAGLLNYLKPLIKAKLCVGDLPGFIATGEQLSNYFRLLSCADPKNHDERLALQSEARNSRAKKHNKLVDWTFTPRIISHAEHEYFKEIAERCHKIMLEATARFKEDDGFRKLFNFSKSVNDVCLIDQGYTQLIPLSRVDIFYNHQSGDWKFCELNTDGTSGQIFMHETERLLKESSIFKRFTKHFELETYQTMQLWAQALKECYEDFLSHKLKAHADKNLADQNMPHLAIVDWEDSVTESEVDLFVQIFSKEYGMDARFIDTRDLEYKEGQLYAKSLNWPIDIVWRRAVSAELFERMDEGCVALIEACKDQAVCSVGGFITHPASVKEFLPILCSLEGAEFLSPEDHQFFKDHSPKTIRLSTELNLDKFLEDPAKWIVKAAEGYGGCGVYAGLSYLDKQDQWERIVKEAAHSGAFVIQEYIQPYKSYELDIESATGDPESFDNLVGLYLFNGRFGGVFQRIGRQSTISSEAEVFYQPVFKQA